MHVFTWEFSASGGDIIAFGNRLPGQDSASVASGRVDVITSRGSCQSDGAGPLVVSCQTTQVFRLTGYGKDPGEQQRLFVNWNPAGQDIMMTHICKCIVEHVREVYFRADGQYGRVTAHGFHGRTTVRCSCLVSCQPSAGGQLGCFPELIPASHGNGC